MAENISITVNENQDTGNATNDEHWGCMSSNDHEPMVSVQITLPESMRNELLLAAEEIFYPGRSYAGLEDPRRDTGET